MPKQKPKPKAVGTQYIAFDDYQDTVIVTGTREEVSEGIKIYIETENLDDDEIDQLKVFELDGEKSILVDRQVEISF